MVRLSCFLGRLAYSLRYDGQRCGGFFQRCSLLLCPPGQVIRCLTYAIGIGHDIFCVCGNLSHGLLKLGCHSVEILLQNVNAFGHAAFNAVSQVTLSQRLQSLTDDVDHIMVFTGAQFSFCLSGGTRFVCLLIKIYKVMIHHYRNIGKN